MTTLSIIQVSIEIMLIIMCVMMYVITAGEKKNRKQFRLIWIIDLLTAGMMLSDVLAICYRGNVSTLGYYMVRISNFFNFAFLYALSFYSCFLVEYIFEKPKRGRIRILIAKIAAGVAIFINVLNIITPIIYDFDESNKYYRLNGWYVNSVALIIAIIMLTSVVISLRDEIYETVAFMLLLEILMPLIASVVQVFIYGLSILSIALGFTQIFLFIVLYYDQIKHIKESDNKLEEYNAKLMLTQVQPHFMLNTLTTVQYLCKTDSEAAYNTIADLGVYLRNNMEFATSTKPISFEKELSHIEKYVSIEKQRFGDRINVVYDIKEKDFEIPALSVQPLVENAIKHGISKKRKGGTVEISSWRGASDIHILIKDDGKGFDMSQPYSTDRVHMGVSLVESRLKRVCAGTLNISSVVDKGTISEIIIPIDL